MYKVNMFIMHIELHSPNHLIYGYATLVKNFFAVFLTKVEYRAIWVTRRYGEVAQHVHHNVPAFFIVTSEVIDDANNFCKEPLGPR